MKGMERLQSAEWRVFLYSLTVHSQKQKDGVGKISI
jgi:hypothetical protein